MPRRSRLRRPGSRWWLVLVAGLLALLPACSSDTGVGAGADQQALDFVSATVDGGELDGSTLAGNPVVLWFWAPS